MYQLFVVHAGLYSVNSFSFLDVNSSEQSQQLYSIQCPYVVMPNYMVLKNLHTMISARNITIIAVSVMAAFASVVSANVIGLIFIEE
jgi:Mn2+/Fe2+ NRAMP family transporter